MALGNERNVDLAFDTDVFRNYGKQYGSIATSLRKMSEDLDDLLVELKESGWTTPAGAAFQEMAKINWEGNIGIYADLLDTLNEILDQSADRYDDLVRDYVESTKL